MITLRHSIMAKTKKIIYKFDLYNIFVVHTHTRVVYVCLALAQTHIYAALLLLLLRRFSPFFAA